MFLTNFELTQAILSNKNALGDVLKLFLKDTLSFEGNPYDRKVKFKLS